MKAPYWFPLFNHMEEEHGKTLTDSELNEIAIKVDECRKSEITDTDRLNWLLERIDIADIGDDETLVGVIVRNETIQEELQNQSFIDGHKEMVKSVEILCDGDLFFRGEDGWEGRVLRDAIDEAIRKEREG